MNYYNEFDPFTAKWLRNLIAAKLIPDGYVDERSIKEVQANDLKGFTQCHFFAGIAGWSLALQIAGWPTTQPVWTGSCPCQPFSAAGKRKGTSDERHLWPEFRRLIAECRPAIVFGEQVASKDGRTWLAGVRSDLEGLDYAVGAADLCAAGEGAPCIRQRLWWVGDSGRERLAGWPSQPGNDESQQSAIERAGCDAVRMGNALGDNVGRIGRSPPGAKAKGNRGREVDGLGCVLSGSASGARGMADADGREPSDGPIQRSGQHRFWSQDAGVVICTD